MLQNTYEVFQLMSGSTKTWLLLLTLSAFFLVVGFLAGQQNGLFWGFIVSLGVNLWVYFWGDQRSAKLFPGQKLEGSDPWGVLHTTAQLSEKAYIPTPKVFVVNHSAPQSMALGRNSSRGKIFLTQGLLEKLDKKNLQSVLAYHIAGIKRHNTFVHNAASCLSSVLASTILLSPLGWFILKLCAWPNSYFQADKLAASYLENPKDLATALWKLNSYSQARPLKIGWWLSPLFIVNPLTRKDWSRYFIFQPNVEKRIEKLTGNFPI